MESIQQNLLQIKALRNSRIQSEEVLEQLAKREESARNDAQKFRRFASMKKGRPANTCYAIAQLIEAELGGLNG